MSDVMTKKRDYEEETAGSGMSGSERDVMECGSDHETETLNQDIADQGIAVEREEIAALLLLPKEIRRRLRKAKIKGARYIKRHMRYVGRGRDVPYIHPEVSDFSVKRTKADLYEEACRCDIPGRSRMTKSELESAIGAC